MSVKYPAWTLASCPTCKAEIGYKCILLGVLFQGKPMEALKTHRSRIKIAKMKP